MSVVKTVLAFVLGVMATFWGKYGVVISLVSIAIIFDVATGCIKATTVGKGLDSRTGAKGFWKKIAYLVALGFGIFLDYGIPYIIAAGVAFELPFSLPLGATVGVYIILTESISVIENLYEIGMPFPKFILNLLKIGKERMEEIQ